MKTEEKKPTRRALSRTGAAPVTFSHTIKTRLQVWIEAEMLDAIDAIGESEGLPPFYARGIVVRQLIQKGLKHYRTAN